jgi:hypothetical protein
MEVVLMMVVVVFSGVDAKFSGNASSSDHQDHLLNCHYAGPNCIIHHTSYIRTHTHIMSQNENQHGGFVNNLIINHK